VAAQGARHETGGVQAAPAAVPAFYIRAAALFRDLALARADGSLRSFLLRLSNVDVLVIDWAMTALSKAEARDFWEICEDRCQTRSLVLTSQMPVANRHRQIGDSTIAEGILDRIALIASSCAASRRARTRPSSRSRSADGALRAFSVLSAGQGTGSPDSWPKAAAPANCT
jgi:DNA replication protein DnaC